MKKAKQLIIGVVVGALLFGILPTLAVDFITDLKIINNPFPIFVEQEEKEVEAYNIDGYTYLKLADVGKALDVIVKFNETESKIEITKKEDKDMSERSFPTISEEEVKEFLEKPLRVRLNAPRTYEKNGIIINKIDGVEYVSEPELIHLFFENDFDIGLYKEELPLLIPNTTTDKIPRKDLILYEYDFIEQNILPYIDQDSFELDGHVFKKIETE